MDRSTQTAAALELNWRDYYELTKPNVVALMILCSVIGMFMSVPGMVPWRVLILGNLGIAMCAGAAAAVNHLVDRRVDLIMARTKNRPIAQGRITTLNAVVFVLLLGGIGMWILLTQINAVTAWLTFASLVGYAVIYTLFLKHATPQNIVIGGLAGAAPPLLGWTAVADYFCLDTPSFLGFSNSSQGRICRSGYPDVAGDPWRTIYEITHFALHTDDVCCQLAALCHGSEFMALFVGSGDFGFGLFILGHSFVDWQKP